MVRRYLELREADETRTLKVGGREICACWYLSGEVAAQ